MRNIYPGVALLAILPVACSGGGSNSPAPANRAPTFNSAASATVAENTTGVFYNAAATDADGDTIAYSISGAADSARFSLTGAGALSFLAAPDFEAPTDANADNVYEVTLQASDGALTASLALRVTVTDAAENFRVRRIAVGLSQPLFLLARGDGSNRVFVVEKQGQVEILDLSTGLLNPTPFLDIGSTISSNDERGLLGMALAPDFATSGVFYVNVTNLAGDTEIRQYRRSTANADLADPATVDVILAAAQPASNHNGGWLGFGPDSLLYVALGDGGGSNDPFGNGQNLNTLLGKMLRVDPSGDDFPADPLRDYRIPAGNPFAGGGGRPEIYAYGLRNPFRASFDRQTGDLLIGDVGQGAIEEVDLIRPNEAGLNFGWPILEGTRVNQSGSTAGMTPPIAEYAHGSGPTQGNSITGGYVYRGPIVSLQGSYVFADFISDNIWSIEASSIAQGATLAASTFRRRNAEFAPDLGVIDSIASFGEDAAGNLYIIGIDGEIYAIAAQ